MTEYAIQPEHIHVDGLYDSGNSHGVRLGNIVFWSGITARQEDGSVFAPDDVAAQANFCFEKIGAMLRATGADYGDILKLTIYTTNSNDRSVASEVKRSYLSSPRPASTGVVVVGLSDPTLRCEIEAISFSRSSI